MISLADSRYKEEIKRMASDYVDIFFHDKKLTSGRPIIQDELHTDDHVSLVMNTGMLDGIQMFYETFNADYVAPPESRVPLLAFEIRFLMRVFDECSRLQIPKQFASGIAMIYLKMCSNVPKKMAYVA